MKNLFTFLSLFLLSLGLVRQARAQQHPDYQPLADLYNATQGGSWTNRTNWISDPNPCNWYGIGCDGDNRVTTVDLRENNLDGTLPASLGDMTSLQTLNLSNNRLSGAIPGQLGDLKNLKEFFLSSNQLTGAIPGSLGGMTSLQLLYLQDNRLSGEIPGQLGDLKNLKELNIT